MLLIQIVIPVLTGDAPDTDLAGYLADRISGRIYGKAGYRISGSTYRLIVKYWTPAFLIGQIYECFLSQT
jgi:hypothetical protein